jgi:hypothetical protein
MLQGEKGEGGEGGCGAVRVGVGAAPKNATQLQ